MTVYDVDSTVPLAMAASDVGSVAVVDSVFEVRFFIHATSIAVSLVTFFVINCFISQSVPWPGFYIYNVTRASITGNHFVDTANKAIIAKNMTREIEFYEFCKQRLYRQYLLIN